MKKNTIAFLVFLSTLPFLSFGQQTSEPLSRTPTAHQLLEIQVGELELFKTLVYRFETAWEETDLQSMSDLRSGLLNLMAKEINQLEEKAGNETNEARLTALKACLNASKETPINQADTAVGKKAEESKELFQDFIKLMEADLAAQIEALRSID